MKLLFIGDVMLGRLMNDRLKDNSFSYPWGDTLDIFNSVDVRFCNLECAISDKGEPWTQKVFYFRSDAKNVAVLKEAGIDCVSLANNHALDYGYEALWEMLDLLKAQKIHYAGAGKDNLHATRPAVFEVQGLKIGFLAFTDNEPTWEAKEAISGINYVPISLSDKRYLELIETVKKTKSAVDILIVSAHWGPNWGYRPQEEHIPFAHGLIDSGADMIFGHSCHVYQGVEIYENCPIIYSAGDFIDDYAVDPQERNDQSFIFVIELEKKKIQGMKLYPTIIKNFQARHAKGEKGERIAQHMKQLCEDFNTIVRWNGDLGCLEIQVGSSD